MSRLLTEDQAADRLGVSPRTLAGWRSRGGGPMFIRLGGKSIRYRIDDLNEFVADNVRRHTSEYEDDEEVDDEDEGEFDEE